MTPKEREALLIFMHNAISLLDPKFTKQRYDETTPVYETGEESDEFLKFPVTERQAFYMRRAAEVIAGKLYAM